MLELGLRTVIRFQVAYHNHHTHIPFGGGGGGGGGNKLRVSHDGEVIVYIPEPINYIKIVFVFRVGFS